MHSTMPEPGSAERYEAMLEAHPGRVRAEAELGRMGLSL